MSVESTELEIMFAPPVNRAMQVLDRSFFTKTVRLAAAVILEKSQIHPTRQQLKHETLAVARIHCIVDDHASKRKALLLNPQIKPEDKTTWGPALNELVEKQRVAVSPYDLQLSYDHWQYSMVRLMLEFLIYALLTRAVDILKAIIPVQEELPTGFSLVGHVGEFLLWQQQDVLTASAHLNLRSQYLPYKNLIAAVLMDKNPVIRTVINKIEDVGSENAFRTFKYEVLAGEPSLDVEVKEQNCIFRFNYAKVYWNSRLHTEHERLVAKFQPGEAVCDLMAGVGPFAIPAGRKKVFVRANDLNPESFDSLVDAVKRNHVSQFVKPSNADARAFVRTSAAELLQEDVQINVTPKVKKPAQPIPQVWLKQPKTFDHYVMNLPASAITFLDAFVGLYHGGDELFAPHTSRRLPMIHVYCFGPKIEDMGKIEEEIRADISKRLGYSISQDTDELEIYDVRDVAPLKRMFCASFRLPADVAFRKASIS